MISELGSLQKLGRLARLSFGACALVSAMHLFERDIKALIH